MSYCLNPNCVKPDNPDGLRNCEACGSLLLLQEQYQATRVLGRGGFGTTFLAIDVKLPGNPTCVIKQLRPAVSAPHILAMARELFLREATTLGKVGNHPQLPRLLAYFEAENEFYLVQEYVAGLTLQQEVKRFGAKNEEYVRQVLLEVLPILDYLHNCEVIHRDIKPANLIRREIDNKLVLIDFGAVKDKVTQAMVEGAPELSTFTSFAVGTPVYAPPEQMAMRPVYASDIYALAVTCIYLLTGKSPKEIERDNRTGEWKWKNHVHISEQLTQIMDKMLEDSVKNRYQNAMDVVRALQAQSTSAFTDNEYEDMSGSLSVPPRRQSPASPAPNSQGNPRSNNIGKSSGKSSYASSVSDNAQAARYRQSRMGGGNLGDRPLTGRLPLGSNTGRLRPGDLGSQVKRYTANQLLTAYSQGQRDFVDADLSNLVLRNRDLSGSNFANAKLENVDFKDAILASCNFGRANLQQANLAGANLTAAYLVKANLSNANLKGATLREASLSQTNLQGADLSGADLINATGVLQGQLDMAKKNWFTKLPK